MRQKIHEGRRTVAGYSSKEGTREDEPKYRRRAGADAQVGNQAMAWAACSCGWTGRTITFIVKPFTRIPTPGGMLYQRAGIDLCGGMALSWRIDTEMAAFLVTDTVRAAPE